MGSIKFTLTREVRNEISQYIDNEFMNEILKEAVKYIQTTGKVEIDDSSFNQYDENSKIILKDIGTFNVYDYMYFKDFLDEVSWEGSYVENEEEVPGSNDYRKIIKYEPKDVGHVIYEKVKNNMEQKKSLIYKEYKKKYNEEFLFESVRFYKRTRDGKEYYEIKADELNQDKKRSIVESIKTEFANAFKSRWGTSIISKISFLMMNLCLMHMRRDVFF
ncbi:hypothetical protein [Clostridium butyricum]